MYSVKLIVDELLHGSRTIITNVPLRLGNLNAYLQEQHPSRSVDLFKRVILIDDEQMGVFFTIRPPGSKGPHLLTKQEWTEGKQPDYSGVTDSGVMYVIDEVHIKFNARAWMTTGQDVIYYLSQHRKLGDDVVWITQAIGNVDKQFRSVTQDFTYIRNLSKERMSHFRLPSIFTRQTYTTPPTDNSTPMETGTFRMNVSGLASLYDTAKGVGIHGRSGADTEEKKKGMPWWVGVVAVALVVTLAFLFVPKVIAGIFSPKIEKPPAKPLKTNVVETAVSPQTKSPMLLRSNSVPHDPAPATIDDRPKVYVTGYDRLSGRFVIYLSDGGQIREGDDLLQQIHHTKGVLYDGKYIPFAKPERTQTQPPVFDTSPQDLTGPYARYRVISPSGKTSTITQ